MMCQGYYRHNEGYTPEWDGMDKYKGQIVHTEEWPEDLDYTGKKVIVIGSGGIYTELLNDAREEAMQRMKDNAGDMGADAVINVRIVTSMVSQMASEILIYGTAVRLD